MEGVAAEAASLAGHLGLGKLIALYDDNQVSLAGKAALSFSEDVPRRFEGLGWHTQTVADGERPRRDRQGDPGRAGGADAPVSHRRADGDRLRGAEEGRNPRGPRRAAGRRGAPRREAGPRLAARAVVPPAGARASARFREAAGQRGAAGGRLARAPRRLAPGLPGPRGRVGPRAGADAHRRAGTRSSRASRRTRRWRPATRAAPCSPPCPRGCRTWSAATPTSPRRPRRSSRRRGRSSAARPRAGTSTSACASTRWARSPTASPTTAGSSCSAARSSSSPTTCARRCGWPRSPSCPSCTSGRTTRSGSGRTGRRTSRSSTWRRSARCRTWWSSGPATPPRPWWPGRSRSRAATARRRSSSRGRRCPCSTGRSTRRPRVSGAAPTCSPTRPAAPPTSS